MNTYISDCIGLCTIERLPSRHQSLRPSGYPQSMSTQIPCSDYLSSDKTAVPVFFLDLTCCMSGEINTYLSDLKLMQVNIEILQKWSPHENHIVVSKRLSTNTTLFVLL